MIEAEEVVFKVFRDGPWKVGRVLRRSNGRVQIEVPDTGIRYLVPERFTMSMAEYEVMRGREDGA